MYTCDIWASWAQTIYSSFNVPLCGKTSCYGNWCLCLYIYSLNMLLHIYMDYCSLLPLNVKYKTWMWSRAMYIHIYTWLSSVVMCVLGSLLFQWVILSSDGLNSDGLSSYHCAVVYLNVFVPIVLTVMMLCQHHWLDYIYICICACKYSIYICITKFIKNTIYINKYIYNSFRSSSI